MTGRYVFKSISAIEVHRVTWISVRIITLYYTVVVTIGEYVYVAWAAEGVGGWKYMK